jgi:hypothetical protein
MGQYGFMWQADLRIADAIFKQALTSHMITAKHAALAMMPQKRGVIVEITENDMRAGGWQSDVSGGQERPQAAAPVLGGRPAAARHRGHCRHDQIPAL